MTFSNFSFVLIVSDTKMTGSEAEVSRAADDRWTYTDHGSQGSAAETGIQEVTVSTRVLVFFVFIFNSQKTLRFPIWKCDFLSSFYLTSNPILNQKTGNHYTDL